jgi:hypothetical protein
MDRCIRSPTDHSSNEHVRENFEERPEHENQERPNGGVDGAARIHSSIAERIKLRNTPPPLASNDLLCCPLEANAFASFTRPLQKQRHLMATSTLDVKIIFTVIDCV